jgi:hypothetical protein
MPDSLYEHDILAWSAQQAELLRRVGRGERANGVDWAHVVEEIEDVGASQLNAVRSYLRRMLVHLLKLHGWPGSASANHWRQEVMAFQADAEQRFSASMRQLIDLDAIYARAVRQVSVAEIDGVPPRAWPDACPVGLDTMMHEDMGTLEARFAAGGEAAAPTG